MDIIRRCIFRPYRKGMGPTFTLTMWDTGRHVPGGPQWQLGYRLTMRCREQYSGVPLGKSAVKVPDGWHTVVLFEGEDYGCSPLHCIDSDDAVVGIMRFLTLRHGDTDSEYFDNYTPEQLDYCSSHAEALSGEVDRRFCDEDGNVRR